MRSLVVEPKVTSTDIRVCGVFDMARGNSQSFCSQNCGMNSGLSHFGSADVNADKASSLGC